MQNTIFPPTILAYRTVLPISVTKETGKVLNGTLSSFYYADGSEYQVKGTGAIVYTLDFYTNYPDDNPNQDDPYIDMKLYFSGGGVVQVKVRYYDGTKDTFQYSSDYTYWFWKPLDAGKTVKRIRWTNSEWWNPGKVYVDIAVVYYD